MKKLLLTAISAMGIISIAQAQVLPFAKQKDNGSSVSQLESKADKNEQNKMNTQVKSLLVDVKKEIAEGLVLPELITPEETLADCADEGASPDSFNSTTTSTAVKEEPYIDIYGDGQKTEPAATTVAPTVNSGSTGTATTKRDYSNANIYIVVGAFEFPENAAKLQKQMAKHGIQSDTFFNSKKGFHYVYIEKSKNIEEAEKNIVKVRRDIARDAWIYIELKK